MALNLKELQSESIEGRFSIENITSDHARNFMNVMLLIKKAGRFGGFDSVNEIVKNLPK